MSAPVLTLLHGYPFDHTVWNLVRAGLPASLGVYCPDLSWVAAPAHLPSEPSLDILADEVAAALRQQGIERAVLAGFSMGGYVALAVAERHPSLVSGLALINSQTAADTEEAQAGRRSMISKIREKGWPVAAEAAIAKMFASPNEALAAYARHGAERAGEAGLSWALEAMARRPDRTRVWTDSPAPALVVHSSEDQFVPVGRARQLAESRPGTAYAELQGVGHGSPLEAPTQVREALEGFAARYKAVNGR